ncbi:c-type cytochrome [Planctomycetales bacterium ZRK34]|nr:c-type cytochrome [Planctomycetales bacterium ZRK34]
MLRLASVVVLCMCSATMAVLPEGSGTFDPAKAKNAAEAMAAFDVAEGLTVDLYAAEPLLQNPVAIDVDEAGRVFVVESDRFGHGVSDDRGERYWLNDDLAANTIEDRLAYYKKWAATGKHHPMTWYTDHDDRVRLLLDENHDGKADRSTVFAGPFNQPLDGLASGVLAIDGEVYLTNIPSLYRLRDTDHDHIADKADVLSTGYGVRTSFLGHDLHGLTLGPDGKLYFTVGDRGYNVPLPDGSRLYDHLDVGRGAVFRCNRDGSGLEVVYTGLRNPQELAFDDFGNLFTGDNNSDAGDKARLVYCVEGGDAGWMMGYQYMESPYLRGPWHEEKIWHLRNDDQPAWALPPVAHIGNGPCGFMHYPGTGLDPKYNGHFFLGDYRGQPASSKVWSFTVKPDGASFTAENIDTLIKGVAVTDVTMGYDGRVYLSDWTGGWSITTRGRVYTLADKKHIDDEAAKQVRRLFKEGFAQRPVDELVKLLGHVDRRVRQRAQFALANQHAAAELLAVATDHAAPQLARVHAVWGYGQIADADASKLYDLLADDDAQIVVQVTRVLGERGQAPARLETNIEHHPEAHVRMLSAIALRHIITADHARGLRDLPMLINVLRDNNDADLYLRHGLIMAMASLGDDEALLAHASDESPAVRMGVLLTLRRHHNARIARFLDDKDEKIVTETARAIYDLNLTDAMPALAAMIDRLPADNNPLARRVINANLRLGGEPNARAVAQYIARGKSNQAMQLEAVAVLGCWSQPEARDRVHGSYFAIAERDPAIVKRAVAGHLTPMLAAAHGPVQTDLVKLADQLSVNIGDEALARWVADYKQPVDVRVESLRQLAKHKAAGIGSLIDSVINDKSPLVRHAAREALLAVDAPVGVKALIEASQHASQRERQLAYEALAHAPGSVVDDYLAEQLGVMAAGKLDTAVELELVEAARQRSAQKVQSALKQVEPLMAQYTFALEGGDASRGSEVFAGHTIAQCMRCHRIDGKGGEAGPDLSHVASRVDRAYLLESIITPNAKIAQGFDTVVITTKKDNQTIAGTLKSEDDHHVTIAQADGKNVTIDKSDIASRTAAAVSAMPPMGGILKSHELRDVIAYLASRK